MAGLLFEIADVTRRHIVQYRVAGDHVVDFLFRHVLALLADHHRQLGFAIELARRVRLQDIAPGADYAGRDFDETGRHQASLLAFVLGVIRIVAPDRDDLAAAHWRIKPAVGERQKQFMPAQAQRLRLGFHEVRQPAIRLRQRLPRRRTNVQELRDVPRQENRRELAPFGVTDFIDQITRITGAQVRNHVVADQHAEARLRSFFAFPAVAHYFHDSISIETADERR